MPALPKPDKRIKNKKLMKCIHNENEYIKCECCGKTVSWYCLHHKKRRSQGGDDSKNNLAKLCKSCDTILHSSPTQFIKLYGKDKYFELLPSLKNKFWLY